ncbi:MAG: shikimate synthase, partial [Bdellovibrionales bacterium]|nr:shikimate synthase [Bdellovibrionales bacterium]
MRTLIVGHRGTGKTSLLKRLDSYLRGSESFLLFDLDQRIEERQGKRISDIFSAEGEDFFRELEVATLAEIDHETKSFSGFVFVAAGAGFKGKKPEGWSSLWIRRSTDLQGRIFLDRPRLDPLVEPLNEFLERMPQRNSRYRDMSERQFILSEGFDFPNSIERQIILSEVQNCGGIVTLKEFDVSAIS